MLQTFLSERSSPSWRLWKSETRSTPLSRLSQRRKVVERLELRGTEMVQLVTGVFSVIDQQTLLGSRSTGTEHAPVPPSTSKGRGQPHDIHKACMVLTETSTAVESATR
jgi:hypothetical protein